jgi:hypothetical protein
MLPSYGACQLPAQQSLLLVQKLEGAHHVLPSEKKRLISKFQKNLNKMSL